MKTAPVPPSDRASVLIIVLWVAFGLVSIALYFAHSMSMEYRAAENRSASMEADQAILGAARYATNILTQAIDQELHPSLVTYQREDVPVGESRFWFIGRGDGTGAPEQPVFGLVDEASKLHLNAATAEMLELLPRMTPALAAAILDWRDDDSDVTDGGAEDETYLRLNPPYSCKNAPFESVEELRLVAGMTLEILYGEDLNQNGVLDPNENDGDLTAPPDNRDGRLDPGLVEFLTVLTREPTTAADGTARIDLAAGNLNEEDLRTKLGEFLDADRVNTAMGQLGNLTNGFTSVLEFYSRSGLAPEDFALVEESLYVSTANNGFGLVNVNTASLEVLTAIPGIGTDNAPNVVARRQSNPSGTQSLAWLTEILDSDAQTRAGPYVTGRSYHYIADVAALGRHARGLRRVRWVIDTSGGNPRFIARRDLSAFGWPLGKSTWTQLALLQRSR